MKYIGYYKNDIYKFNYKVRHKYICDCGTTVYKLDDSEIYLELYDGLHMFNHHCKHITNGILNIEKEEQNIDLFENDLNSMYITQKNNQEIKQDDGKLRISLVPLKEMVERIARVRMYGVNKYGNTESWKDVSIERYEDAFLRHMLLWQKDRYSIDEESGLTHFDHMLCNMMFLAEQYERY